MTKGEYYGYSKIIHERATRYIDNEIWANQTSLILDAISNLYRDPEDGEEEPQSQEIYEWYLVSNWIAKKLDEQGEPILYGEYNFYWGRTCTGQTMILDGTFQKIAESYP